VNYIVTERRRKFYDKKIYKGRGEKKRCVGVEEGAIEGSEIVKEIKVCPKCFLELTGLQPKMQTAAPAPRKKLQGFNRPPPRRKWKNPKAGKSSSNRSTNSQKISDGQTSRRKGPVVEKVPRLTKQK